MKSGKKLKKIKKITEILYYYRDIIGVGGFLILYIFSEINIKNFHWSLIIVFFGLIFRLLGYFYLGDIGYSLKFQDQFLIVNGIYSYFRHPIYLGNFFILIGFLLFLKMPVWLYSITVLFFVIEYSLFIYQEEIILKENKEIKIVKNSPSLKNCLGELKTVILVLLAFLLFFLKI
jgi:protein-S-isoprenylcysteine O-methyltransferase Ste14